MDAHTSNRVTAILTKSFASNPSALWVIKQDHQVQRRLKALIEYAVKTGIENEGVYLSPNGTCAAICIKEPAKKGLKSYLNQLILIYKAIGFSRVPQVLKREAYLKKHRPVPSYLNFWFLGSDPDQKNTTAVFDIKKEIFSLSKTMNLPILLETSVERNKQVYERFGFNTYHVWQPSKDYTLWFMKRDVR